MKTIYRKLLFLLLLLPFFAIAQNKVEGMVVDNATGLPIPGVNVKIEGSASGASTGFDGKFQLSDVKPTDVLSISYMGYSTRKITVGSQTSLTIKLQEDSNQLKEVVVQVGYGSVKKKDATGSLVTVTAKDFNKGVNTTTANLISGRVAGVAVNTSGAPGSGSEIRIRGGSSLFAGNDPLIVIDGLPLSNTTNTGSTSFLASLNPNTVESMTVLKDASATAIYGSRASNGVILITTKKGGKDLQVEYNFQYGSGKLVDQIGVFTGDEFRELVALKRPNDVSKLGTANTNWQKAIYRQTDFIDQIVSLRGSLFNIIPTRLSVGNTYQEGLRLKNQFNRTTTSLVMNPSFLDNHLKLKLNANYTYEKNQFSDGIEGAALRFDPTQPIYDSSSPFGGFFEYRSGPGLKDLTPSVTRNPVAQLMQTNIDGDSKRFYGNFEVDYKFHFLPELRAVVNVGFDETNGERTKTVPGISATADQATVNGILEIYGNNEFTSQVSQNKLFDSYLAYNKTFDKLNVDATVGYSYQIFKNEVYYTNNVLNPKHNPADYATDTDNVLIGLFARANFTYNDKYVLTASFRRDGSSRFSKDNQWGNFPAAAFAWKLKEEFFKDSQTVSDLKFRLGYGVTGQQDIGDAKDFYLQKYTVGDNVSQYAFNSVAYPIGVPVKYNSDIKWEETTSYNAGLDFAFLDNRFSGSLDVYHKEAVDLLANVANADGSNFGNRSWQNVGGFDTNGIELTLNADVIKNDSFRWNVNVNASKFERRITDLTGNITVGGISGGTGSTVQILKEGFTPYSFWVRKQLYDVNGNPLEGAFADLNGNGIQDDNDKYLYKNPDPDVLLGFASTINYKNLDFSFNLRASIGNRVYNNVDSNRAQYKLLQDNSVLGNIPTSVLDSNFTGSTNLLSDYYVENASYLKMDNITLGYTFPNWLEGKASLRLSGGVQNVFTITEYSGLDPEVTGGIDNTIYPRQRSILFGANIKF
jgi:TonB-linked SusC/RagA family outer membrane protein